MSTPESDRQLLGVMVEHGADLLKPAHTIHNLYFGSLDKAESAAKMLRDEGFEPVRAHRSPPVGIWERIFGSKLYSCIAETRAVPSELNVLKVSEFMRNLASDHDGTYDGWEASIEK